MKLHGFGPMWRSYTRYAPAAVTPDKDTLSRQFSAHQSRSPRSRQLKYTGGISSSFLPNAEGNIRHLVHKTPLTERIHAFGTHLSMIHFNIIHPGLILLLTYGPCVREMITLSSAEIKRRVELYFYFYSPFVSSWKVIGWNWTWENHRPRLSTYSEFPGGCCISCRS